MRLIVLAIISPLLLLDSITVDIGSDGHDKLALQLLMLLRVLWFWFGGLEVLELWFFAGFVPLVGVGIHVDIVFILLLLLVVIFEIE